MSLRQRKPQKAEERAKSLSNTRESENIMDWIRKQPLWIVLGVASGACAAINGVFAKLYDPGAQAIRTSANSAQGPQLR